MKPYDYLALVPIVEGAGGIMTDWKVNVFFSSGPEGLPQIVPHSISICQVPCTTAYIRARQEGV